MHATSDFFILKIVIHLLDILSRKDGEDSLNSQINVERFISLFWALFVDRVEYATEFANVFESIFIVSWEDSNVCSCFNLFFVSRFAFEGQQGKAL